MLNRTHWFCNKEEKQYKQNKLLAPGKMQGRKEGIKDFCFSKLFLETFTSPRRKSPHAAFPSCCECFEFKLTTESAITLDSGDYEMAWAPMLPYRTPPDSWREWTSVMDKQKRRLTALGNPSETKGSTNRMRIYWRVVGQGAWLMYVLLGVL